MCQFSRIVNPNILKHKWNFQHYCVNHWAIIIWSSWKFLIDATILITFCPVHRRVSSTVCSVLSEYLWKNFTSDSGGIRTHDLLLTSADVLTSRPPSLPDDNWPARIPYSSGFRDYRSWVRIPPESPVKFFLQIIGKHWIYSAIHTSVYRTKLNQLFITRRKN